jgi:hypothetical protein
LICPSCRTENRSGGKVIGPDHPEARAAADEAHEIFTRLRSKPMLERLDGLVSFSGFVDGTPLPRR